MSVVWFLFGRKGCKMGTWVVVVCMLYVFLALYPVWKAGGRSFV